VFNDHSINRGGTLFSGNTLRRSFMPFDALGKMLFPRLQSWERRRRVRVIFGVLFASVVMGGVVGIMIYKQGISRH
jgi:hypothetical protein